jgi:hypothetical protein
LDFSFRTVWFEVGMAMAAMGQRVSAYTKSRFILILKKPSLFYLFLLAFFGILSQSPLSFAQTSAIIAAGDTHSCARLSDGTVRCWGANNYGQLGNGTTTGSSTPVAVNGMTAAVEIAAGGKHNCARLSNGTVNCWGLNGYGQLGNGSTTTFFSAPVVVSGMSTAIDIAAGANHSCAVLSNGTVNCWGDNSYGQLGNGTSGGISRTPVAVSGISTATAIVAGGTHSCARLSDGTVRCWGRNNSAQLV